MALEIMRPQTPYVYRQNEEDRRIIERRVNQHGARWQWYRLLSSEDEARQTLLKLNTKIRFVAKPAGAGGDTKERKNG